MFGERMLLAAISALVGGGVAWGVLITKVGALDRRVSALDQHLDRRVTALEQHLGRSLTRLSNQLAYLNGHLSARGLAPPPRPDAEDGGA